VDPPGSHGRATVIAHIARERRARRSGICEESDDLPTIQYPCTVAAPPAYLLVTPVRNEAEHVRDLVANLRAQERRPALWVIVDDASSDGTSAELDRLAEREPWIHPVVLPREHGEDRPGTRYSEVVATGIDTALELAAGRGIAFRYLANLDADIRCPPQLFAELMNRMDGDRMVGIAGAVLEVALAKGGSVRELGQPEDSPRGCLRMWRRQCLEQTGYYATPHWAGVTGLRARNRGWKTVVYDDLVARAIRASATRDGWWTGYRRLGQSCWYVGWHPASVTAQAMMLTAKKRDWSGIALLTGYLEGAARRARRSHDPEVLSYYSEQLPRQHLSAIVNRVPPLARLLGRRRMP